MIRVENLHRHFGGFRAVDGATLEIAAGSITGLVGPNGAGKTTLFNVIAGALPPTSGRVLMDGEDITGLPPHALFHKGLLRTFQIAHEFSSMTCRENLMMVPGGQSGERLWNTWTGRRRIAEEERALRAKADEVLEFLTIAHLADHPAGQVSGGQKKLLELGRTMMVDAQDRLSRRGRGGCEPHAAEHHRRHDPTAEHRTRLHLRGDRARHGFHRPLCAPVICMAEGRKLAEGSIVQIKADEAVIEAYLGTGLKNKGGLGA